MDDDSCRIAIETKLEDYSVNEGNTKKAVTDILHCLNLSTIEISLLFVEKEEIRALNLEYLSKDKETDVLSFPQNEWAHPWLPEKIDKKLEDLLKNHGITHLEAPDHPNSEHILLGDIVICPAVAKHNATALEHSLDREIYFLIAHGILHLLGHDHEETADEEIMTKIQRQLMENWEKNPQSPLLTYNGNKNDT